MKKFSLFIDETGVSSPKNTQSNHYVLCGCAVEDRERENIRNRAEQLKFKYWGWESSKVVFHSIDMARREKIFRIFKDNDELFNSFQEDLLLFLSEASYKLFFILVDKEEARKQSWNDHKIQKETTTEITKVFLLFLLGVKARGKINIEISQPKKDVYYLKALNFFLGGGLPRVKTDFKSVQETLTAISFVTKKNNDIEEQICDIFAYAGLVRYLKKSEAKSYEEKVIKVLNSKIYKVPTAARLTKMRFYNEIKPFLVLPKK